MGFVLPKLPSFDIHRWYWGDRAARLRPMCQHWGEYGFGAPWAVYLLYLVKLGLYLVGCFVFVAATPGIGPVSEIGTWWTDPVVFQKAVLWSLLFEVLGLGCGSGPLTLRYLPPIGGVLHWLRPGTLRLPPWPGRIPLTAGNRRTGVDVLLYAAALTAAVWPLVSPAGRLDSGLAGQVTVLAPERLIPLALLLPLLGLRDKTIFLAARAEHYWVSLLAFFLPYLDMIVTLKILLVLLWWAAAASKLNRLFPFTLAAVLSNAPPLPKFLRKLMFQDFPEDMRPSRTAGALARLVTLVEFVTPLVLLVSDHRSVTLYAVGLLVVFHLATVLAIPPAVPLEWNLFLAFAVSFLFYGHFADNLASAAHPLAPALLAIPVIAVITWGNLRPDQVSFLASMRYYSGNWATSLWALKPAAVAKIDANVVKFGLPKAQLKRLYGEQIAEVIVHKVATFRALHHHGRALFGLLPRAGGPNHEEAIVLEGDSLAGTLLGWHFGDGHLHNEQLIEALQERCRFEPGEVRVVLLEAVPIGSDRHEYRLVDAAVGQFERGYVLVDDLVSRQPWEIEDLPAYVLRRMIAVPGDERSEPPTAGSEPVPRQRTPWSAGSPGTAADPARRREPTIARLGELTQDLGA